MWAAAQSGLVRGNDLGHLEGLGGIFFTPFLSNGTAVLRAFFREKGDRRFLQSKHDLRILLSCFWWNRTQLTQPPHFRRLLPYITTFNVLGFILFL